MTYDPANLEAARAKWREGPEPDEAMAFVGSLWRMHAQEKKFNRDYFLSLGIALPATVLSGASFGTLRQGGDYELYLTGLVGLMVAGYGLLKAVQASLYERRQAREIDHTLAELSMDGEPKISRQNLDTLCNLYLSRK